MLIPGLGLVRKLIFSVLVLVALFIGANIWAERAAEGKIADLVQSRFELDRKPAVDLRGFPVLLKVLRGDIPDIVVSSNDVDVDGMRFERVEVELADISVEGSVLSGEFSLTVGSGRATARATDEAVTDLVRRRGERATVRFRPGGATVRTRRVIAGAERRIVARCDVSYEDGILAVDPRTVTVDGDRPNPVFEAEAKREATVRVEIPELPGGIRVRGIDTERGALILRARLKGYTIAST